MGRASRAALVVLALLLMELGIFQTIAKILGLYSNFAVAWIGALVADLVAQMLAERGPALKTKRRIHRVRAGVDPALQGFAACAQRDHREVRGLGGG